MSPERALALAYVHYLILISHTLASVTPTSSSLSPILKKKIVTDAVSRYAVCNDFTPAAYYIREGSRTEWIVHLESGGGCSTISECNERYDVDANENKTNELMSSIGLPNTAEGRDFLSPLEDENPTFYGYSHVFIPYCSSDLWLGQGNNSRFPNDTFKFHNDSNTNDFIFRGLTIFRSVIDDLIADHNFSQATTVILSGSSAGGVGAVNHIRWLRSRLRREAAVSVISDSAWFIDFENNMASRSNADSADALAQYRMLPECRDESRGYPCCLSAKCMIESSTETTFYPTDVPLFLIVSVYDLYILAESVKRLKKDNDGKAIDSQVIDYARTVYLYGGAMNESVESVFRLDNVSYFMPACSQHVYLASSSLWDSDGFFNRSISNNYTRETVYFRHAIQSKNWMHVRINGTSLRQALETWYDSNFTAKQEYRDNCGGLLCNDYCPDEVDFRQLGIDWSRSMKLLVVSLSILVSVCCGLSKLIMLAYQKWLIKNYAKFDSIRFCFGDASPCLPDCPDDEQMNISCLQLDHLLTTNKDRRPLLCRDGNIRRPSIVRAEKEGRHIINSVSSYFNPGEMVAIMGPSGSGKTTLLDVLTGRKQEGTTRGEVLVNGCLRDSILNEFVYSTSYVMQLATPFYEDLTVIQNLLYSSILHLPRDVSWRERFTRIQQVMTETGLTELADTPVGGATGSGLSGGQKRRLSVALQLLSMPSLIFLDEPTSGLDASSSLELLRALHCLAMSGRNVILTIHQPRLEIFHLFDKILLLCKGQVAYFGTPFKAPGFFREALEAFEIDIDFQESHNPADAIMDMLKNERAQESILNYYRSNGEADAVCQAVQNSKQYRSDSNFKKRRNPRLFHRIFALECRASARQTFAKLIYLPVLFLLLGLLNGSTFWKTSSSLMIMSAFCIISCSSAIFISSLVMSLLTRPLEIFAVEKQDGVSSTHDLILHVFLRLSAISILPVIIGVTITYLCLVDAYNFANLALVLLIQVILNHAWIAFFTLIVSINPVLSHRICPIFSALAGFFSGFIVAPSQMPVYYRWIFPLNPTYWGYTATARLLLQDAEFNCSYKSHLECFPSSGLFMLQRFGIHTANPYETLAVLLGMIAITLLSATIVLQVKFTPRFWKKLSASLFKRKLPKNKISPNYFPLRRLSRTPFLKTSLSSSQRESDEGYNSTENGLNPQTIAARQRQQYMRQASVVSALLDDDIAEHIIKQSHDVSARWETSSIKKAQSLASLSSRFQAAASMPQSKAQSMDTLAPPTTAQTPDVVEGSMCSLRRRVRLNVSRAVIEARKAMMEKHLNVLTTTVWKAGQKWLNYSRSRMRRKTSMHKSSSGSTTVSTSGRSGRRFSVATCTSLQRRSVEEEHARIKSKRRRSVCFAAEAKNDDDDDDDVSDDNDDVFEAGSDYSEETRVEIPENWRQVRRQTLPLPRVLPPLSLADRHESLPCLNEETDSAVALLRRKNSGSTTSRRASVPSVMIDFKVSSPRDENGDDDDDEEEEIV